MQAAVIERPKSVVRNDLCTVVRKHLESHPHFRGRMSQVSIAQDGRTLCLTGRLPTFYLKQLVQEAVRHVPGVQNVVNQIDVVSASGISSAHN